MTTAGTPNGGLDEIGRCTYIIHPALTLVAYTNVRDSLTLAATVTTLVQPGVLNGYAPILLNGVWSSINGDVTYVHPGPNPHPRWNATGAWSAPVTGVAVIYNAIVMHFMDLPIADFVPVNGSYLEVDLQTII